MKIKTREYRFNGDNPTLIQHCDDILTNLYSQGYQVTLRTLYYQLVSRNLIENSQNKYSGLSKLMTKARYAGLIDWDHITDGTRELITNDHWWSPQQLIETYADYYTVDLWEGQSCRPEIWVEKNALSGIFLPLCREFDVPLLAIRGNSSTTTIWNAGNRFARCWDNGQSATILYFGDHDPTGLNISKNIQESFGLQIEHVGLRLKRIALNLDQVERYRLPPNPAKETDPNYKRYEQKFGKECWELDALDPSVMIGLAKGALEDFLDWDTFNERKLIQLQGREELRKLSGFAA